MGSHAFIFGLHENDYRVATFGDGRAAFYFATAVGVVAPSGFQCVAEILVGSACQVLVVHFLADGKPTNGVGLALCYSCQYQLHN